MEAIEELRELRATILESIERVADVSPEIAEQNDAEIRRRIKLLMDIKADILRFEALQDAART
jgi:hypothetical protein